MARLLLTAVTLLLIACCAASSPRATLAQNPMSPLGSYDSATVPIPRACTSIDGVSSKGTIIGTLAGGKANSSFTQFFATSERVLRVQNVPLPQKIKGLIDTRNDILVDEFAIIGIANSDGPIYRLSYVEYPKTPARSCLYRVAIFRLRRSGRGWRATVLHRIKETEQCHDRQSSNIAVSVDSNDNVAIFTVSEKDGKYLLSLLVARKQDAKAIPLWNEVVDDPLPNGTLRNISVILSDSGYVKATLPYVSDQTAPYATLLVAGRIGESDEPRFNGGLSNIPAFIKFHGISDTHALIERESESQHQLDVTSMNGEIVATVPLTHSSDVYDTFDRFSAPSSREIPVSLLQPSNNHVNFIWKDGELGTLTCKKQSPDIGRIVAITVDGTIVVDRCNSKSHDFVVLKQRETTVESALCQLDLVGD